MNDQELESFGKWMRARRRALDLTQNQLAQLAGCAQVTIRKIEADELLPSKQLAEILAENLGVAPQEREAFVKFARSGKSLETLPAQPVEPTPWRDQTRRDNLPQSFSSFIGREKEIEQIKMLVSSARLVTLTGAGGVGKTRLALEAAEGLRDDFVDGVWLIELAPVADPALVPQSVATALGLRNLEGTPLETVLKDYLRDKNLLLILDNCEHLLEACARLIDELMRGAPRLKILPTSREPLGIIGESTYRVPSLSLPHSPDGSLDAVSHSDAAKLFMDRAVAVKNDFAITQANAPAVAQICRRLDGIPLAIELAAACVKALSVEEITARLDDRFRLLTGGSRTAMPRQQTLRAAMDWSYGLLSASERTLLQRLSVFAGGWTYQAAESVCAGEGIKTYAMVDLIAQLVSKSLVIAEEREGETRYRMLETTRQYAREKLLDSGEAEQVRNHHLKYFLDLAVEAELNFFGPAQVSWFNRLEHDHDNLRAALAFALPTSADELALRLGVALGHFWRVRGYWSEGQHWLQQTIDAARAQLASRATAELRGRYADALNWASDLAFRRGDYAVARSFAEEGLGVSREVGVGRGIADALNTLGNVSRVQGDNAAARKCLEESLAIRRELGDGTGQATSLNNLGLLALDQDDSAARALFEQSVSLSRELGDKYGMSSSLHSLGLLTRDQGDFATAREVSEQTFELSRELGDRRVQALALNNLGSIAMLQGYNATARVLVSQGLALRRELGDRLGIVFSLLTLGLVALDEGDYASARGLYRDAITLTHEMVAKQETAYCLVGLAALALDEGQARRATYLSSAANALLEGIRRRLHKPYHVLHDQTTAAAHAQLSESDFNAAWNEASAMSLDQAVEYALKETT